MVGKKKASHTQVRSSPAPEESRTDVLQRLYVTEKRSTREVGLQLGVSNRTISDWLKRAGIPVRSIAEAKAGQKPAQKTIEASVTSRRKYVLPDRPAVGYKVDSYGYILLWMPDHPMADGQGYVKEHRLVLAKKLGRILTRDEDGHHLDENRANNHPDNIELKPHVEHLREHSLTRGRLPDGSFAPAGTGTAKVGTEKCSVAVCDRQSRRRGLCAVHSSWSRRNGGAQPTHAIRAR